MSSTPEAGAAIPAPAAVPVEALPVETPVDAKRPPELEEDDAAVAANKPPELDDAVVDEKRPAEPDDVAADADAVRPPELDAAVDEKRPPEPDDAAVDANMLPDAGDAPNSPPELPEKFSSNVGVLNNAVDEADCPKREKELCEVAGELSVPSALKRTPKLPPEAFDFEGASAGGGIN